MVKKLFENSTKIFSSQQNGILSAAGLITFSSMGSALLGLLRNRLLVARFFSSIELQSQLDAYWVAFRLPELAFQLLIIGSISAAFIPVYSKYKDKDKNEARIVCNSIVNLVLLVFVVISVLIFIFAEQFNHIITSEQFSLPQVRLAANLSRVMLLAQFFFGLSNFATGVIQSNQRFLVPALAPMAYNIGIILGIVFLSPMIGIYGPAVGVVIGAILHFVVQLPLAIKLGFSYKPIIDLSHKGVREMIRLMPPRTLAITINQLELFASVYFATALSSGSLTIVNLAQQLMSAPNRVFSVPLGQASLPFLSNQVAGGKMDQFKETFAGTLRHIMFLAIPASALLLILRVPLVRIAYGSSEFPWLATILTGKTVAILSICLFAQGGIQLLIRAFYALHNTALPFVVSLVSVALNVLFSYLLVFVWGWGVLGLAVAQTTATLLHFGLLLTLLMKSMPGSWLEKFFLPTTRVLIASMIMAVFLWVPMRLLDRFVFDTTKTIPLIILTIVVSVIGGGVYLLLAVMMKIPEYEAYLRLFKKVGNVKKLLAPSDEIIETPTQTQEVNPI